MGFGALLCATLLTLRPCHSKPATARAFGTRSVWDVLATVGAFPKPFGPDHKAPGINPCPPELPPIGFSRCREGTVANSSLCYSCRAGSRRASVRMPNFVSYGPGVVRQPPGLLLSFMAT